MSLTYQEFINKIGNERFCKFINKGKKHSNLTYKEGINEDILSFNPNGSCTPGGLYFTNISNARHWINYGCYVVFIELCEDAIFYIEPCGTKYKTNKFKINKFISLDLKENEEQTEEICKLAVQQDGYTLEYVKEQTEEICKLAVQQNGLALQYVKEQTEEINKI